MMTLSEKLEAVCDFWRPNRYGLKTYLINDDKEHPFAVICPGGGYGMVCSYVEGLPYAKALNEKGYHAIVVYYRVKNKAHYPAPQNDLEHAIREIFAHAAEWKLDTENWSLWGSSAGGHLVASFCTERRDVPKPNALILTYPVIIMDEHTHADTRKNLVGKQPDPMLFEKLSVNRHITKEFPPTYVWNGTDDRSVDPINSRALAQALQEAGVPYLHDEFAGVGHGVGLATGTAAEPWFDHAISFWEEQK